MSKNIYVRFGQLYEAFDEEKIEPKKISVPDDSLIFKCSAGCVYHGKHDKTFHYILISKSMSKKQVEKLENLDNHIQAITKIKTQKWMTFDYVKFNGYSAVLFTDCLISEYQENFDNIIGMKIDEEKLNSLLFPKPIYLVYLSNDFKVSKAIRIESMHSPSSICCSICDNLNNLIYSHQNVSIDNLCGSEFEYVRNNTQQYCKDLFDEIMYKVLSNIYDGFKEYKANYDLDWLANNVKEVPVTIIPTNGTPGEEIELFKDFKITSPNVDYWNDIFKFKKRFPKH